MGTPHPEISDDLAQWITKQSVFFVATAPDADGHVNVSPKGLDTLRVLGPKRVAYLDLTGSAAETVAHTLQNGRITLMWCSFAADMRILRVYGEATPIRYADAVASGLADVFPELPGARSIIDVNVTRVSTSCGFGLPVFESEPEARTKLLEWAESRGQAGIVEYQQSKNAASIDGLPTFDW